MSFTYLLERTLSIDLDDLHSATYRIKSVTSAQIGSRLIPQQPLLVLEKTVEVNSETQEISTKTVKFPPNSPYKSPSLTQILVQPGQVLAASSVPIVTYQVEETFANLIETLAPPCVSDPDRLYFRQNIPQDKLKNAIQSYADTVDPDKVIFLYDSIFWGMFWDAAKEGFLITDSGIYLKKAERVVTLKFNEVQTVELHQMTKAGELLERVKVTLNNGEKVWFKQEDEIKTEQFSRFLETVLQIRTKGLTKDVDGYVIVEDMSDSVKLAYLSLLVWLTYQDDQMIDAQELSELQVLMTQLNFSPSLRAAVRRQIVSPQSIDSTTQTSALLEQAPTGCEQVLAVSLLKDAIRVHRSTKKTTALAQPSIQTLAQLFSINTKQLDFIEEACIQDERLLSGDISDSELTKAAKDLAAKAGSVGVPVAAVYLSGSVVGLSAAGVTSGLATLGLGGILGLSSMVTGIGVAIVLGVGIYQGAQWLMGGAAQEDKRSRRDLMLQEVLTIHRKAIANLAEDIAYLSEQLVTSIVDAERNRLTIQKLSQELTIFASAMRQMRSKEQTFEQEM